jgi:hypothetical protein
MSDAFFSDESAPPPILPFDTPPRGHTHREAAQRVGRTVGDWTLTAHLGRRGRAEAFTAVDADGRTSELRILERTAGEAERIDSQARGPVDLGPGETDAERVVVLTLVTPLAESLPAGGVPADEAVQLGLAVLDGLRALHEQGVVLGSLPLTALGHDADGYLVLPGARFLVDGSFGPADETAEAPEGAVDPLSDLFALGQLLDRALRGSAEMLPASTPDALFDLIEELTAIDPSARPASLAHARARLLAVPPKGAAARKAVRSAGRVLGFSTMGLLSVLAGVAFAAATIQVLDLPGPGQAASAVASALSVLPSQEPAPPPPPPAEAEAAPVDVAPAPRRPAARVAPAAPVVAAPAPQPEGDMAAESLDEAADPLLSETSEPVASEESVTSAEADPNDAVVVVDRSVPDEPLHSARSSDRAAFAPTTAPAPTSSAPKLERIYPKRLNGVWPGTRANEPLELTLSFFDNGTVQGASRSYRSGRQVLDTLEGTWAYTKRGVSVIVEDEGGYQYRGELEPGTGSGTVFLDGVSRGSWNIYR